MMCGIKGHGYLDVIPAFEVKSIVNFKNIDSSHSNSSNIDHFVRQSYTGSNACALMLHECHLTD